MSQQPKKYFLQKAHAAREDLVTPDWEWSIKLDGIRALWDGGVSRGRNDAPWMPGVPATGLWSINAKPIYAPDWWLDEMPNFIADGELWAGPKRFQFVSSVVRRKQPDERWNQIVFAHHTDITVQEFTQKRVVNEPHCRLAMLPEFSDYFAYNVQPEGTGEHYDYVDWHSIDVKDVWKYLNECLETLVLRGHEGMMLRPQIRDSITCERSWELLKLKPFHDVDVLAVGVVAGKETEKGSRLLGRMGSLVCYYRGQKFRVGGFSDHERDLISLSPNVDPVDYAADHPGEELPPVIQSAFCPGGTELTIKYRELTDKGVPKEGRFWRKL